VIAHQYETGLVERPHYDRVTAVFGGRILEVVLLVIVIFNSIICIIIKAHCITRAHRSGTLARPLQQVLIIIILMLSLQHDTTSPATLLLHWRLVIVCVIEHARLVPLAACGGVC